MFAIEYGVLIELQHEADLSSPEEVDSDLEREQAKSYDRCGAI